MFLPKTTPLNRVSSVGGKGMFLDLTRASLFSYHNGEDQYLVKVFASAMGQEGEK